MDATSLKVGKKYWFTWAGDAELGVCQAVGSRGAVLLICRGILRGHARTCSFSDIIEEDGVDQSVSSIENVGVEYRSVGPRRINLDDGNKTAPKPARRWWEIWRTN